MINLYFMKRSFLYVTRKLSKAVTIGVILFIVSSLVLTGFLIQTASKNAYNQARKKLGANVTYIADFRAEMQEAMRSQNSGGASPGQVDILLMKRLMMHLM